MFFQHILGLSFLVLGFLSVSSYTEDLSAFRIRWFYKELKPMQERWGMAAGTALHVMGYVVAPIGFGILFLMGVVFPF
jgi:hypothetical protein